MVKVLITACLFGCALIAQAKPAFTGINFSGTYECKGNNEQVGDYQATAIFKLNRISSHGKIGAYDFSTDTENAVIYRGQAIANGTKLALSYKYKEGKYIEYSTGIAEMKKIGRNRWSFRNMYYEPDDNGGNYGYEDCVMQAPAMTKAAAKALKNGR